MHYFIYIKHLKVNTRQMLVILDFNVAMEIHFIQFILQFSNLTYFSYCHVLQYEPNLLKYY